MRNRVLGSWWIVIGPGMIVGCSTLPVGSGRIVSEERTVDAFDAVAVESGLLAEVTVTSGAAQAVTVVGDDNLIGYLETSVVGGVLRVHLPEPALNVNDREDLRVEITVPALTMISADGAADVTVHGVLADRLTLSSSGAARIAAFGEAEVVDAHATGGARIEARTLAAHDVVARADGAGQLEVCADTRLELHLSGGSHALYACSPRDVTSEIQSGSSAQAE